MAYSDISLKQAAKTAGIGLLFMFLFGIYAGGPSSTHSFDSILESTFLLRINIACDLMMLVFDIVAALGLYSFFRHVNSSFSRLCAWFRLAHVAVYSTTTIFKIFIVYFLTSGTKVNEMVTASFSKEQIGAILIVFLQFHEIGFRIGLVFFGFHFVVLGYLILKSSYVSKYLGIMVLIISLGYLANSFGSFLFPSIYIKYETEFQVIAFLPAIVGEFSLCLYLLFFSYFEKDKSQRKRKRNIVK